MIIKFDKIHKDTSGYRTIQEFLSNFENNLDQELLSSMGLTIKFKRRSGNIATLGTYSHKTISITLNGLGKLPSLSNGTWHASHHWTSTIIHELGHAWDFMLSGQGKEDYSKKAVIQYVADVHKIKVFTMTNIYKSNKKEFWKYVKKSISTYASKNIVEAFAELFTLAFMDEKNTNKYAKPEIARNAIRMFNTNIKRRWLEEKITNSSNDLQTLSHTTEFSVLKNIDDLLSLADHQVERFQNLIDNTTTIII